MASRTELDFDEAASQSTTQAAQIRNLASLATQLRIASVRWENMSSYTYALRDRETPCLVNKSSVSQQHEIYTQ